MEGRQGPPPVPPVPAPAASALPPPLHPYVLFHHSNVFAPMVPPLSLGNGLMTGAIVQGGGGSATVVSPVRPITSDGFGKIEGGDLSSLSPSPVLYVFNGGLTGRKVAVMEKVVERRQRQMIKNRESTSRSCQRKQIIARANQLGEDPFSLSKRYYDDFLSNMAHLQCLSPSVEPHVSDNIDRIIDMIKQESCSPPRVSDSSRSL